jgi:hypothetical protein
MAGGWRVGRSSQTKAENCGHASGGFISAFLRSTSTQRSILIVWQMACPVFVSSFFWQASGFEITDCPFFVDYPLD